MTLINREVKFSKPATYSGTKTITVEFDPFDENGEFNPIEYGFKIEKHKGSDKWNVSIRKHAPTGSLRVFDYTYIGSDPSLQKIKKWILKKFEEKRSQNVPEFLNTN